MSLIRPITLVLLLLGLCCGAAIGQRPGPQFRHPLTCEPVEPRTKLEALDWQYERVLIKGFTQIVTLTVRGAEIRVDAIELKESASASRVTGLVIALKGLDENGHEDRSFVDYDEIDRLLKALDTISQVNESVTKLAGFEARYRTLGDLEFNVFRQSRSGSAVSLSSGICNPVTATLTLDELDRLKAHIVEAKTRLDEIK